MTADPSGPEAALDAHIAAVVRPGTRIIRVPAPVEPPGDDSAFLAVAFEIIDGWSERNGGRGFPPSWGMPEPGPASIREFD